MGIAVEDAAAFLQLALEFDLSDLANECQRLSSPPAAAPVYHEAECPPDLSEMVLRLERERDELKAARAELEARCESLEEDRELVMRRHAELAASKVESDRQLTVLARNYEELARREAPRQFAQLVSHPICSGEAESLTAGLLDGLQRRFRLAMVKDFLIIRAWIGDVPEDGWVDAEEALYMP